MKKLTCIVMLLTLTSCGTWQALLQTKAAQHTEESVGEAVAETAIGLTGTPAHVEIDLNPDTDPSCMHCPFHCPRDDDSREVGDPLTCWDDVFAPKEPELDNT